MDRSPLKVNPLGIAALMCWMSVPFSALAAPPVSQRILPNPPPAGEGNREILPRHLDLRAPPSANSAVMESYGTSASLGRFSRSTMRAELGDGDYQNSSAAAAGPRPARITGNIEAIAQRFRHEGLPVARLWENHAALVSLGLNAKGKPGLWLVQKIH